MTTASTTTAGRRITNTSEEAADRLAIARKIDVIDATMHERPSRGFGFEPKYNLPELSTADGIAEIDGNYPSKGIGERAAWFRDSKETCWGSPSRFALPRQAAAVEQQIRELITQSPAAVHARDIRASVSGDKQHRGAQRATLSQRTNRSINWPGRPGIPVGVVVDEHDRASLERAGALVQVPKPAAPIAGQSKRRRSGFAAGAVHTGAGVRDELATTVPWPNAPHPDVRGGNIPAFAASR